ncbi:MAG TPA: class I SAM-dependent methyltransferase [Stellaceae bacterium]|nr:class I SAM-dependent methyltransferase [Stellaceae bacterium]
MADQPADYPAIAAAHVRDARLFASREDMIAALPFAAGGVIGEVGVGRGDLSELLLDRLEPSRLVAFDTFTMHEYPYAWGRPAEVLFHGETHLDFYRRRFSDRGEQLVIERGWSHIGLARYPDHSLDLICLDSGHDYEIVKRDLELVKEKIKRDGILMFAGYMAFDHLSNEPCGVVRAVNELLVGEGWRVFGLALHKEMYCDIAVRR